MDCIHVASRDEGMLFTDHISVLERLATLYGDDELSDITLLVGGRVYSAHRLILGTASPVLKVMLLKQSWSDAHKRLIYLKEDPMCSNVFGEFLKYIYMGNIHLTSVKVLSILMLADKYHVGDLTNICLNYMSHNVFIATQHGQLLSWYRYAIACSHVDLVYSCHSFAQCNFTSVMNAKDFVSMEEGMLISFVEDTSLVIPDEFALTKGIRKWIEHNDQLTSRQYKTNDVLPMIRYDAKSYESFLQCVSCSANFADKGHLQKCNGPVEREPLCKHNFNETASKQTPRNYTNDKWCAVLTVENYKDLPTFHVRSIIFSSPCDNDSHQYSEWSADLYAKGVHFGKCTLIGHQQNRELPESTYETVRLTIRCLSNRTHRVNIAILIMGDHEGQEYVCRKVERKFAFDNQSNICHMNDIVPYNPPLNCVDSHFLIGDTFKIAIIIKPDLR